MKNTKMRKSKYVGNTYSGWTVTHIGIASVQSKKAKWAFHRNYYYLVERVTSDGKCEKQIRLNGNQMVQLARGTFDIEAYALKLKAKKTHKATNRVNYSFN